MKKTFFWFLCFIPLISFAQVIDDFSDGDFTNNPTWIGDVSEFIVNANFQLQSNGPAANATLHLSTASTYATTCEWRFWVRCAFNPSTTNLARIYLIADQADLESSLNGYYIQIGGVTGNVDAIDLFRQDGTTRTKNPSVELREMQALIIIFLEYELLETHQAIGRCISDITGGYKLSIGRLCKR
ncbi:MAG: hypothetical protein KatS3mg035_1591 [Bacteroidia bacterium]|nr:MAG: hypothetical protein KatS3mg035_1591 [Bacteroidia bacterium]